MAAATVAAAGLDKSYGPTVALEGAHLDVDAGEIVALAGENGSGKSTLAKILAGIVRPDGGTVIVRGRRLEPGSVRDARDHGIAYVAQEPAVFPRLSVADNVLMPSVGRRWLRGVGRWDRARVQALTDSIGLRIDVARPMGALGPAQQVLVELARALILEPTCLILDEVTTRMPDPQRLLGLVRDLAGGGMAIVFITHRFAEIAAVADRVRVLRNGVDAGELAREEVDDDRLTELMVGRSVRMFAPRDAPGAARDDTVLRVEGLRARGGRAPVDLAVRRGEIVGLGGLMGSGRTELLETIIGARPRSAGVVRVNGRAVAGRIAATLRAGVGFVPEDRNVQGLIAQATVATNIALQRHRPLLPARRRDERRLAARMVERLSIKAASLHDPVRTLSGGNAQKVMLGRALAGEPEVLVLDEPTRGVDVRSRAEIYRIVEDMADRGCGVLVASSDLPELVGLCDRVLVLYDQCVAGQLVGDEVTEANIARLSSGAASGSTTKRLEGADP